MFSEGKCQGYFAGTVAESAYKGCTKSKQPASKFHLRRYKVEK